jgi:hypothetical protein
MLPTWRNAEYIFSLGALPHVIRTGRYQYLPLTLHAPKTNANVNKGDIVDCRSATAMPGKSCCTERDRLCQTVDTTG